MEQVEMKMLEEQTLSDQFGSNPEVFDPEATTDNPFKSFKIDKGPLSLEEVIDEPD